MQIRLFHGQHGLRNRMERFFCMILFVVPLMSMTLLSTSAVKAQNPQPIVRIEEDWFLQINNPDAGNDAPQIINVISPTSLLSDLHAILELNHSTLPDYQSGGMQLQVWKDEEELSWKTHGSSLKT